MEPAENKPFIRETIEEKPRMSFGKKLLLTVFLALVFGAVAAITFVFGRGVAERFVTTTESETAESIFFPPDNPPGVSTADEPDTTEETAAQTEATPSDTAATGESGSSADPSEAVRAMIESMLAAKQPDIHDLQMLYQSMGDLVSEMNRALVTVSITRKGTDAFGTEYTYEEQNFGVIVAITSKEILILTPYAESGQDDGSLNVHFVNNEIVGAYTKSTDKISGLAMLAVTVRSLSDAGREMIKVADLGNSYNCTAGQPVIAMGAPAGANGSLRYGMLTHLSQDVAAMDNTLRLLHTDMSGFDGSRGFLIDLNGEVVGLFSQDGNENGLITAVGISDIKSYLQNMSNGLSTAYLGITGHTLSGRMKEQLGIEENGVYILSCADDGPAMVAGLMSGDILTSISGEPVISMLALRTKLLDMNTEQTVKITVLRSNGIDYQPLEYDVHLERR